MHDSCAIIVHALLSYVCSGRELPSLAKSWPLECMQKASGDLVAGTEVFRGLGQCHMSGNGSEKAPKHCECEYCEVCRASLQVQDYAKALDLSQHTSATDSSPDHSRLLNPPRIGSQHYMMQYGSDVSAPAPTSGTSRSPARETRLPQAPRQSIPPLPPASDVTDG